MSTSRSGLRVKYHDIVRVRRNQKKILYRTILEIECSMFNEYEIY